MWAAHGLQPAATPRSISPGDAPTPAAAVDGRAAAGDPVGGGTVGVEVGADMSSALSKIFTVLDPLRDLLASVLDGWQPPAVIVVGDESAGKSTILEQLAMLPVFPRKKRFCTRLAIHVRLRRSHEKPSVAKLTVQDAASGKGVPLDGDPGANAGPYVEEIPIGNGFVYVQDRMQAIIDDHVARRKRAGAEADATGVVSDKILVLEVQHPSVPSIDLIDLPGLTTYPEKKAREIHTILEHTVARDAAHGGHAMYLAIVPASGDVRPNTNTAMAFIERHALKSKTFGVFSKCDQVTDPDVLRSLVTGCDTEDGEGAEDMGAVHLEKGWVASMLKKPTAGDVSAPGTAAKKLKYFEKTAPGGAAAESLPPDYFDTHNVERLYLQKKREKLFFTHKEADPVLLSLHASGHAGVGSLVARIEREYHAYLQSTWRVNAMEKIFGKLDEKAFEVQLLGGNRRVSDQVEEELEELGAAAEAEMDRRLKILDEIFGNFQSAFLDNEVRKKLAAVLVDTWDAKYAGAFTHVNTFTYSVHVKDCENIVKDIKAGFDDVISDAIAQLKPFLMETLRATITAQVNVAQAKVSGAGQSFDSFSLSIPWLKGAFLNCLESKFFSMRSLHKAAKQKPLFQLSNYKDYTDAVLKKMDDVLTLVQEQLAEITSDMRRQFFDSRVPSRPDVFSVMIAANPMQVVIVCDSEKLCRHFLTAFVRGVAGAYDDLKCAHRGMLLGAESEAVAKRRAELLEEIRMIERARDGLCSAMNITEEEMYEMRDAFDAATVEKENANLQRLRQLGISC